jgi:hypothetical protein
MPFLSPAEGWSNYCFENYFSVKAESYYCLCISLPYLALTGFVYYKHFSAEFTRKMH